MTALKTAADTEAQIQQMTQKLQEQQIQSATQVQAAKVEQDKLVQQLVEAQKKTQETVLTSQRYEQQMIDLTHKVDDHIWRCYWLIKDKKETRWEAHFLLHRSA